MVDNSIYEVRKVEYKAFVEQIKSECRDVKTTDLPQKRIVRVYSKLSGDELCRRVSYKDDKKHEKYYIFKTPLKEESAPPVPHAVLELSTPQEVQAVFDAFSKMRKERERQND